MTRCSSRLILSVGELQVGLAMRRRLIWTSGLIVLVAAVGLTAGLRSPRTYIANPVQKTNDASGKLHVIYELTNMTSKELVFGLATVEAWDRSGWHSVSERSIQREVGLPRGLAARSACVVHVVGPSGSLAMRGTLEYETHETRLRRTVRRFGTGLGLPFEWFVPRRSIYGTVPVAVIDLPEVQR